MKKRILALALAGTTAFSVFGGAMSANAATVYWNGSSSSSHEISSDSYYYSSYVPAGDISWSSTGTVAQTAHVDLDVYSPDATLTYGVAVPAGTKLYVLPGTTVPNALKSYVTVMKAGDGVYFSDMDAFMEANGYAVYTTDANGVFTYGSTECYLLVNGSGATATFKTVSKDYYTTHSTVLTADGWARHNAVQHIYGKGTGYETEKNVLTDYSYASTAVSVAGHADLDSSWTDALEAVLANYNGNYYIASGDTANVVNYTDMTFYKDESTGGGADIVVTTVPAGTDSTVRTTAGYTILDATDVDDLDAILDNPVASTGVVYLYDYAAKMDVTADDFATAWANGTVPSLMGARYTGNTVEPEDGYGVNIYSIRYDVIDEFEAFLEELGIRDYRNNVTYLTAWAKDTIDNYAYQYYNDSVITSIDYNHSTGLLTINYGGYVNLYNFDDLVNDILNAARNTNYTDIQTSELVYLMQQYEKFVGTGYVDEKPVETDEWGDLLASLLEAPTEDEFRTNAAYKKYTATAADYIDKYENAATASAVKEAERQMYNFVTTYQSEYRVSEKADTSNLAASLDNTYFNYNWNKSLSYDGVSYAAEVYAGSYDTDGTLSSNYVDSDYKGAWALYPAGDYSGTVSGSYPGVTTSVYYVNSSYYWFYNVYALAYNVYTDAQFTSVADLAASALDDAVEALTPTYNAYSSEILGAEEQNANLVDLIETDYTSSMWANKTKISNYITDRVSEDEIGHIGSQNAKTIANKTVTLMGWQKNQTVVSKADINSVKTAKSNAQSALTALRNDEEKYNAAQANALEKAIEACDYIIDLYDGDYSKSKYTQSINGDYSATTGDKDQILKSMITDAVEGVDAAINFSNVIQGWSQNSDGEWMYGTTEGYLNDGWHQVDGGNTWFYFNEDGTAKQSEWMQENGNWYWFNSNCGAAVGWAKIDGDWYYFKGNNAMKTGWEKVEGSWYYMNSSGKMVTGWCQINGTWYYFSKASNALGQMLANTTTPDGYKVDANGALVE